MCLFIDDDKNISYQSLTEYLWRLTVEIIEGKRNFPPPKKYMFYTYIYKVADHSGRSI